MVTDLDRAVIDFAGRTYQHRGAQMDAVKSELGMSYTTYLLHLSRLVGERDAWEYAPMLMARLSRMLTTRRRVRRLSPVGTNGAETSPQEPSSAN